MWGTVVGLKLNAVDGIRMIAQGEATMIVETGNVSPTA